MKYILGDNPFFGINHSIGSKQLLAQEDRFEKASNVIVTSMASGFDQLMLSAHSEGNLLVQNVTRKLRESGSVLNLALVVPYPHTINNLVAEHGYVGGLKRLLGKTGIGFGYELVKLMLMKKSAVRKSFITGYIETEMKNFENEMVNVTSLCLHNVITDLLLGLGRNDVIVEFLECCQDIDVKPVLISQNPTRVMRINTEIPHALCFSYNSIGYMVNPSRLEVDQEIESPNRNRNQELWAMQILASGNLGLEEAFQGSNLDNFDGILYATNRQGRIADFVDHVEKHFG